jgi:hypothetical protein
MRKILGFIFILITIFYFTSVKVSSAAEIAGYSAHLNLSLAKFDANQMGNQWFFKAKAIEAVLSLYQSPLVNETQNFVRTCQKYNLDCYLLPSIAGLESTFGQFTYPNSHNPFGWGGGYIIFKNWQEAIDQVGYGLRNNYIDKGAVTIDAIGRIYAESPTWATRIKWFMNKFSQKEQEIRLSFTKNKVEL